MIAAKFGTDAVASWNSWGRRGGPRTLGGGEVFAFGEF